uniref:Uncharacterized protein n=1 Tax=Arundo donax TaxID=35708 RepID=A0A0A9BI52_ARUDO
MARAYVIPKRELLNTTHFLSFASSVKRY